MFGKRKNDAPPPRHIAVFMDGNGRWAQKRGLPRKAGHAAGAAAFKKIANYCSRIGVEYLTVYAFSTENWKRPADEVDGIMKLLRQYLKDTLAEADTLEGQVHFIGDRSVLADDLIELMEKVEKAGENKHGLVVNVALNYGGRAEIAMAASKLAAAGRTRITEDDISRAVYTAGQPDPDFILRPGCELRLSNFLLWQAAYTELIFTDTLWPDMKPRDIDRAIEEFRRRKRRFGGI